MPLLIPYLSHIKLPGRYAFDHKSISLILNYLEAYGFDHKSISLSY